MRKNLITVALIFIISVWALRSMFGGPYFTSQDGIHQVARLYHFKQVLKDGVFPPRFTNQAFYGYGYPLFQFNYHLPWYAALPIMALKFDIFDTIKILNFAAYFLSGIFMYMFLKELTNKSFPATIGTIIFMVSPYRFLNIYVRNAVGEVFAFMFFPLVFLFLLRLSRHQKFRDVLFLAISLSFVILSHAMSFVIFGFSMVFFGAYCFYLTNKKKKYLTSVVLSIFLFIILSAYYLLPAFFETKYTQFNERFSVIYRLSLLNLKDLIYSPWGYAGNGNLEGRMSFQFGIANWLATFLSLTFLMINFRRVVRRKIILMFLSFFAIAFSLFLTLNMAEGIWQEIERFFKVDFPWKFVGVAVFWISILFSFVAASIKSNKIKMIIGGMIIILAFYSNRNHINVNKYVSFDIPSAVFAERGTNTEDEYLPKWAGGDMKSDEFVHLKKRIEVLAKNENYKITNVMDLTHYFSYIYLGAKSKHTVKKFYFPGWIVKNNNKKINFTFEENGFFNFNTPSGKSKIEISYVGTPLANMSNLISLGGLIFVLGFAICKCFLFLSLAHLFRQDRNQFHNHSKQN